MRRTRNIAGAPIRSSSHAWKAFQDLLVLSLEQSPEIATGSVGTELELLAPLGRALIAGGHLDSRPLTLRAAPLDVDFYVLTGERSFSVDEDFAAIPGGGQAQKGWVLYVPDVDRLRPHLEGAVASSSHLKLGSAPMIPDVSTSSTSAVDVNAMRQGDL